MNIQRVTLVFSITILQLSVDFICAACPQYQVPHTVDSTTVCCKPVFNCTKDHEIVFCLQDGGTDRCIPCDGEAINPFVTSSVDMKRRVCFNQTESHKDCPMHTFPITEPEFCEHMHCSCNTEDCRYGDPCGMCEKGTPCGVNEQMNAKTGACEPCGDLMNSPAGCGPCIFNETAWRLRQEGLFTKDASSSQKVTTKSKPVVTKLDPSSVSAEDNAEAGETAYNIVTASTYNTTTEKGQGKEEDGVSTTVVIIIIVILVIIAILIALTLYIKKKIKNGDENSRLVVCYRKLVSSERYRRGQDEEAAPPNGDIPHENNTDTKQTLAVSPMVKQNESVTLGEGASGGAECGDAGMALLKEEDSPGNEVEETREKETVK
ncbi:uncharacterized protein LOC123527071 isoform X3 [Mercenaria mercenaria]|uniref:uncharacterized protein LOC123527071 isoform X3 n=1 Tax=Mercenaria mercenaria TaxID=6596 RepID=UPI00234ED535|nr:uncharacterized protein LOC123527071 isoform X3 [Mercenaria mercenaria]